MKQMSLKKVAIATSAFACTALLSFGWSEQRGVSLSVESAQARVGRPLTPMSGAGVARRHYRRSAYGYGYGAGVAGAAAVGTAAAVAATSPNWGWGSGPYYTGGPYYRGGVRGAQAYYPAPAATTSESQPWDAVRAYHAGGPWYGYSGWDNYAARNGISCTPGSLVKGADGVMYRCQ